MGQFSQAGVSTQLVSIDWSNRYDQHSINTSCKLPIVCKYTASTISFEFQDIINFCIVRDTNFDEQTDKVILREIY